MTITYTINGGSEIHGVQSDWQRVPTRQQEDGTIVWNNWMINRWTIPLVTMANFQTLKTAEGDTITSITTSDFEDRVSEATYTTAIMESLVNGNHIGLHVENVTITFRVDVTA